MPTAEAANVRAQRRGRDDWHAGALIWSLFQLWYASPLPFFR